MVLNDMSGGVHEQLASKMTISASPLPKISREKGRSPGWAAFDLKQRANQSLGPEFDIDPYPPISNRIKSTSFPDLTVMSYDPSLRSFSTVVQPSIHFPALLGNDNRSKDQTIIGDSSTKFESKNKMNIALEKLKELHSWADEGLIEDILAGANNDFDQAFTLLESMGLSGCAEENKTKDNVEQISLFEDSNVDKKIVEAKEAVPTEDVTCMEELRSSMEECISGTRMKSTGENDPLGTKVFESTTPTQLNPRCIMAAPVEPEWEEDDIYLCHRKDAIRAIRSASWHSRAANSAFMRGDRISAQKLSVKAQEEWMTAGNLNAEAAKEILTIRNNGNDAWKLDLHGLHASEAVCALQDHLWKIETQTPLNHSPSPNKLIKPKATALQVVTGTGNHSRGQASLPMAVRSFLIENGYRFDEARPGVIDVRPKFRHKSSSDIQ